MSSLGIFPKTFVKLGETIGESQKLVIEKIGSLIVTPAGMYLAPGIHTKKEKDEIKYQMLYTPISVAIDLLIMLTLTIPIAKSLRNLAILGKLNNDMQPKMMFNVLKINNIDDLFAKLKLDNTTQELKPKIIDIYNQSLKIFELTSKKFNKQASTLFETTTQDIQELLSSSTVNKKLFKTFVTKLLKFEDTRAFLGYKLLNQWLSTLIIFPIIPTITSKLWPLAAKNMAPSLDKSVRSDRTTS